MAVQKLFENQTNNNNSTWISAKGGPAIVFIWGTFGGGTVTLQCSPNGSEAFEEADLTFSSKGMKKFYLPPATKFRASLSGASSANVNVTVMT